MRRSKAHWQTATSTSAPPGAQVSRNMRSVASRSGRALVAARGAEEGGEERRGQYGAAPDHPPAASTQGWTNGCDLAAASASVISPRRPGPEVLEVRERHVGADLVEAALAERLDHRGAQLGVLGRLVLDAPVDEGGLDLPACSPPAPWW